jgi:Calcineurin-like phosphoesterase
MAKSSKKTKPAVAAKRTKLKTAKVPAPKHPVTPTTVHRFAHPFFTDKPVAERATVPLVGKRMLDYIEKTLLPFPPPQRDPTMTLADIIGTEGVHQITTAKSMVFHSVGDTGHNGGKGEEIVARIMSADYDPGKPATSPAFFLHLGDVNYYDNTDKGYQAQFYSPYKTYPGKIIAIPGNHDGELFITRKGVTTSTGQKKSLEEFWNNFCQAKPGVPPAAGSIYRQMISQPGVYWLLQTPFADFIGLYSNMAENPGFIAGEKIGTSQKDWLTKTLTAVAKERTKGNVKALIIAVHHPPIASGTLGGHSSSTDMLTDIDSCCTTAGITPDLYLTGHAHNYQRWTRKFVFNGANYQVPFFIAGTGGRGVQSVAVANKEVNGDFTYEKSFVGFGYLTITVSAKTIVVKTYKVDEIAETAALVETVTTNIQSHSVVSV